MAETKKQLRERMLRSRETDTMVLQKWKLFVRFANFFVSLAL